MLKIGVVFEGNVEKEFLALKRHYGIESHSDLLRLLVMKSAEAIQRNPRIEA